MAFSWLRVGFALAVLSGCAGPEFKENQDGIKADVAKVMAAHDKEFSECYHAAVRSEKAAPTGIVRVRFVIRENGQPAGVKIHSSTLGSPATEACVVEFVRGVRFKAQQAGFRSEIVFPLSFGEVKGSKPANP